jgi:hypothetical protein
MRYVVLFDNIVVNIIEHDGDSLDGHIIKSSEDAQIGQKYNSELDIFEDVDNTPIINYKSLSKLEFINHLLANGLTNEELVAARNDTNLQVFWIKLEFTSTVEKSNSDLLTGLDALVVLNYLTEEQKQSVLDNWAIL